ncbi:heat-inducible transcriptional repressor HrcA [Clostridium sp. JN-9]|uniref:heat-inducible transcriptional repressor HrcA n=1 Tax=Clostridium sp. JN-9 TaxID=2507159 RepID=UPI00196AE96C|nr:heat-inducible transcriptional repressor HrcA [Clostridium sp. JN-9]
MDERKIRILEAIINDYIKTAEPVGSRTIAKKYNLGISSATIRNEMADLEDMGYLEQLHSSSGRKPSDKGYRLYVDKLMRIQELSPQEELLIKSHVLDAALYEADKMIKQATLLLSELTKLTCIVKAPSVGKSCIKSMQLVSLDNYNMLLLIVTDSGIIKNNIIKISKKTNADKLLKFNNILNDRLKGLSIEEINLEVINNLKNDFAGYEDIFNSIIPALYESLNISDNSNIYMEGTTNIFNYPEYNNITKAKDFLSMLEDKVKVSGLLSSNSKISVKIGEENPVEDAKECSVISAIYSLGDRPLGSIGVIGPTRIPYSKIITIIAKIVKEINDGLSNVYFDDR